MLCMLLPDTNTDTKIAYLPAFINIIISEEERDDDRLARPPHLDLYVARASLIFIFNSMPSCRVYTKIMLSCALLSLAPSAARKRVIVSAFSTFSTSAIRSTIACPSAAFRSTKLSYRQDPADTEGTPSSEPRLLVNVMTIPLPELEELVVSWGHKKFRASQIQDWIREKGVTEFDEMKNLPKTLRQTLQENAKFGSLDLAFQAESKDGTVKRAYRLHDGQLIESVLMPYDDGRNTACISSQAGCAMGCIFCATGQMGFARQLTPDEIFEQVARFDSELKGKGERLSNVVVSFSIVSVFTVFTIFTWSLPGIVCLLTCVSIFNPSFFVHTKNR